MAGRTLAQPTATAAVGGGAAAERRTHTAVSRGFFLIARKNEIF
jgi:hypothetical protein